MHKFPYLVTLFFHYQLICYEFYSNLFHYFSHVKTGRLVACTTGTNYGPHALPCYRLITNCKDTILLETFEPQMTWLNTAYHT